MSDTNGAGRAAWVGAVGVFAVLGAAGVILARSASPASATGLVVVAAGVAAVLLLAFPAHEIARAIACAAGAPAGPAERGRVALVWETAAGAAWVLGAAAAVAGFVSAFASGSFGLARFIGGIGDRAVGVALGLLLALVFAIPALRLAPEEVAAGPAPAPHRAQRALAGLALLALLAWPFLGPGGSGRFAPLPWLLHWPAWLLVAGGALAIALYLRSIGTGTAAVVGLAAAGTVAIVLGLTRALHGFATVSIDEVAGGLMLAVSSGYAALAGLVVVGLPLLARDRRAGLRPPPAARRALLGFPVVVLLLLALNILLVLVPMEKPAG